MAATKKLKSEEVDALDDLRDVVDDLYGVANLLDDAGRSRWAQEAGELAGKTSAFLARLKKELQ